MDHVFASAVCLICYCACAEMVTIVLLPERETGEQTDGQTHRILIARPRVKNVPIPIRTNVGLAQSKNRGLDWFKL